MVQLHPMINFEDFQKVEIKIGTITEVVPVESSENLLKLTVDFGDQTRQVLSGIAKFYSPEDLLNKQFPFVTNLESRQIMGFESQAMILAAGDEASLLQPIKNVPNGTKIR